MTEEPRSLSENNRRSLTLGHGAKGKKISPKRLVESPEVQALLS